MKECKNYEGDIKLLKASRDYWIMIAATEKEKNKKLEKVINEIEKTIYLLEDKEEQNGLDNNRNKK